MYIYALTALVILALLWYQRRKHQMSLFQRLNIPGPQPSFFTGNLKELKEKGVAQCETEWTKKYGKILGYFIGGKPVLMVTDIELLKHVEVKNFQDFLDRPLFPANIGIPDNRIFQGLSLMPGDTRWKEIRGLLSPGFTTNKMKQMTEAMNKATKILFEMIKDKAKKKEALDLKTMMHGLMMDIVERTIFGMDSSLQHSENSLYQKSVKHLVDNNLYDYFIFLELCLPELQPVFTFVEKCLDMLKASLGFPSARYILDYVGEIIRMRRNEKVKLPDLLQTMIDANMSAHQMQEVTGKQLTASLDNDCDDIIKETTLSSEVRYMTDNEVIGNVIVLMLAGHDTTSTTLQFIIRLIARHQGVQERMREEINNALDGKEPDYAALMKMNYTQQVISETLRLYPVVLMFIFRAVSKSFTYNNIYLPEGLTIQPAIWPLHRDPELWKDANKFDPDRFSPSRKSEINTCAYQPFGLGPRNCIGVRFAFTVMKLVLANLLASFKFVEEEHNEEELKTEQQLFFLKPLGNISVKAVAV